MEQVYTERAIVEIDLERYDELLAKEERLRLIKNALRKCEGFCDIEPIKKCFIDDDKIIFKEV